MLACAELRDVGGAPVAAQQARQIITTRYNVPKEIRRRNNQRAHRACREWLAEKNHKREGRHNQARGESETPSI